MAYQFSKELLKLDYSFGADLKAAPNALVFATAVTTCSFPSIASFMLNFISLAIWYYLFIYISRKLKYHIMGFFEMLEE